MHIFNELTYINNTSLALGFFDGIHLGHRVVLKNTTHYAKENDTSSTVIMFEHHPLFYLSKEPPEQILSLEEKLYLFERIGINNVVLLDFKNYMAMSAKNYLENILIKYFTPSAITTGFNHSFGYNKEGNCYFLKEYGKKYGYKFFEIPPFVVDENIVSCSLIRNKLHDGNFFEANKLLGYNFFIHGIVIKGDQIASGLGFPSANIIYPENKIKIPFGVYFVKVRVNNKEYNGILNYGIAPTIGEEKNIKTEVHIIDFNENIYGKDIKISFVKKIRNQIKFENKEKLIAQIKRDIAFADLYKHFIKEHDKI